MKYFRSFKIYVVIVIMTYASTGYAIPDNSESTSIKSIDYDSSTVSGAIEDVATNFMALGLICALMLVVVIVFAACTFYFGCGHLTCGISINHSNQYNSI